MLSKPRLVSTLSRCTAKGWADPRWRLDTAGCAGTGGGWQGGRGDAHGVGGSRAALTGAVSRSGDRGDWAAGDLCGAPGETGVARCLLWGQASTVSS